MTEAWSWASCYYPIRVVGYPLDVRDLPASRPGVEVGELIGAYVSPATDNVFGQLRYGQVQVRGRLAKMVLHDCHCDFLYGTESLQLKYERAGLFMSWGPLSLTWDEPDGLEYATQEDGSTLYLLPLILIPLLPREQHLPEDRRPVSGIFIQVAESRPTKFKRLGYFFSTWNTDTSGCRQELIILKAC